MCAPLTDPLAGAAALPCVRGRSARLMLVVSSALAESYKLSAEGPLPVGGQLVQRDQRL